MLILPLYDLVRQNQPQSGFGNYWTPPGNNYEDNSMNFQSSLHRAPAASGRVMDDNSPSMVPGSIWGDFSSPRGKQNLEVIIVSIESVLSK